MSDDRSRQSRHLEGPGHALEVIDPPLTLTRYPLTYWPQSTAAVNHDRLPDPARMAEMDLAFREQLISDEGMREIARTSQTSSVLFAVLLPAGFAALAVLLPFDKVLIVAGGWALLQILLLGWMRAFTVSALFFHAAIVPLIALVAHGVSFVIADRMIGAAVFGVLSALLLFKYGSLPTSVYRDWILTYPRLRPETRRHCPPIPLAPSFIFLALILLTLVVLPFISTSLTIAVLLLMCATRCWREWGGLKLLTPALDALTLCRVYGADASHAPGVWYPAASLGERRRNLSRLIASLSLLLAVGTSFYLPHELLRRPLVHAFNKYILADPASRESFYERYALDTSRLLGPLPSKPEVAPFQRKTVKVDPRKTTAEQLREERDKEAAAEKAYYETAEREWRDRVAAHERAIWDLLAPALQRHPDAWVRIVIPALLQWDTAYGALVVLAVFSGLVLTIWILLALYRTPLVALQELRRRVEASAPASVAVNEPRTSNNGHELSNSRVALASRAPELTSADPADKTSSSASIDGFGVRPASTAVDSFMPERDDDGRPEWQWYVDRLRGSSHTAPDPFGGGTHEADHLFLGVEPYRKFPILLDKKILAEHAYIIGETGSGKTALGVMPLLIQLIRGQRDRNGSRTPPPPLVILDLKGDTALFHTVREEVEARRRQMGITDPKDPRFAFRFFTLERKPTHYFNPFQSFQSESRSLSQLCHLFLDSLSLSHGEGYGRSYYSRKNRMLLMETMDVETPPRSFQEVYDRLRRRVQREPGVFHDAFELVATIHALTQYEQIASFKPLKRPEDAIHMPSVIEHSQTVYFSLPALLESISVREVAKLALYSLLTAAIDRQTQRRDGSGSRQVYVAIDEFQQVAAENFKVVLEQARTFGLGFILSHQSQADLRQHDVDLRSTIRTNTRFKQFFTLTDPTEIREMTELSGQEIGILRTQSATYFAWEEYSGHTYSGEGRVFFIRGLAGHPRPPGGSVGEFHGAVTKGFGQHLKPRFIANDILRISDHPQDSLIHVSRGSGYTQFAGMPVALRST